MQKKGKVNLFYICTLFLYDSVIFPLLSVISPLLSLEFPLLLIPSCTSTAVQFLKAWMSCFRLYLNSLSILHSKTVTIICNYLYSFLFLSSSLSVLDKHFKIFVLTRNLILYLTAFSASFLLCSCNGEVCDLQVFLLCCFIGNFIDCNLLWFHYMVAPITLKCKPLQESKLNVHLISKAKKEQY